ncbi:MAG: amino acid permease [Spirochaetes bacterium]|nr:amino acid permease [Spirochaetota bacterium]
MADNGSDKRENGFRRDLGLFDATMIVVGSMIGSGIFIVSADIARTVGGAGWLLVVWVITGALTVSAALSYGELAGLLPQAGGQYVYLRESYNPFVAFLYGWTLFLVIQTGTIAAVAMAFAKFTAILFPALGERVILFTALGLPVSAAQLVAIGSIALLTGVNVRGIHGGKIVQDIFTGTKALALLALIILGLSLGVNREAVAQNLAGFWDAAWTRAEGGRIVSVEAITGLKLAAAVGVAMVGSFFSSDAWFDITFAAGEVRNPRRDIPLSMALGTVAVIALYLLANVTYMVILPVQGSPGATDIVGAGIQFAEADRVGTAAASAAFGETGAAVMAVLIMVSTFGCNNGLILAGARVYYAMARDRLFFTGAGKLNARGVPAVALVLQAAWASTLCLSGTYGDLLDFVIFAVLVFYALTIAGIFVLRKKRPDAARPFRAPLYPYLQIAYILCALGICLSLLVYKPKYTWPGFIIVMLGVPVYFAWRRRLNA